MIDGLKMTRLIQSTDRFDAFEATYRGRKVFTKQAKADKPRELLARVPENSVAGNQIGAGTAFKFRTPEIYAIDKDWLVTEWIDGESLGRVADNNPVAIARILTDFLIIFDQQPADKHELRKTFTSASLADYMREKLPKNLTAGQAQVIAQAKKRFDELQPVLTPAWQDGDLKPEHIFNDPAKPGAYVLIDPEHLDPRWPRFYSLANLYVKYWVRHPQELSTELLRLFIPRCQLKQEEIFEPLLANMIVRCISLHWEPDYDPGAQVYNIPRSQELLKRVLQADSLANLL